MIEPCNLDYGTKISCRIVYLYVQEEWYNSVWNT